MTYLAIGYVTYAAVYVISQTITPDISVSFDGWLGVIVRVALFSTALGVIWKMWVKPVVEWAKHLGLRFEVLADEIHSATKKIIDHEERIIRLEREKLEDPPNISERRGR